MKPSMQRQHCCCLVFISLVIPPVIFGFLFGHIMNGVYSTGAFWPEINRFVMMSVLYPERQPQVTSFFAGPGGIHLNNPVFKPQAFYISYARRLIVCDLSLQ